MITKIDIANFGSFKDFNWKKSIRDNGNNVQDLKRLNIIYGRNYSGKTTLSRIFRALQIARIPYTYESPSFTVYGDKGDVNQAAISRHGYDIRVYNRDFVTDNLSFLVDQTAGEIKTFAIVGETNKEIEESIAAIESKLGSLEAKAGLRYELEAKRKDKDRAKSNYKNVDEALADKLRKHANEKIKVNREYGAAVYNIDSIRRDISEVKKPGFRALSSEEIAEKSSLLKEEVLPEITGSVNVSLKIDGIKKTAEELLQRAITPTQPIQELLNDSILQAWVKSGIPLHKEKRDTCAFCRQELPHDLWQVLDSHFSKESGDLETAINTCIASINTEVKRIPGFITLNADQFYASERAKYEVCKKSLDADLEVYRQDLLALNVALEGRKTGIFKPVAIPALKHDAKSIEKHVETIRALITESSSRSKSLGKDKDAARLALRLSDVARLVDDIDYDNELVRIDGLKTMANTATTAFNDAEKEVGKFEAEVSTLRGKQKDERKGAERVNALLNHFFGHDGIKLEAKDTPDKSAVKFQIMRDGKSAYNLSEGECSLIAFCYFIAKLEEADSKDKELIIYIDDPISSLDSNHIFFMFSLIESLIAKPVKNDDGSDRYRYKQLFITTHNLDFLKYLKKISSPGKSLGGHQYFLIERNGASSNIALMPSYLRDYITEFNYLFHQIYKCRDQELAKTNHEPFYSFGNNLRKFLEAFLFYKYPYRDDKNDSLERVRKFFGDDETAIALANRLNNELSHLESIFDRSIKPIEIPEIPKLADYVLDKIYKADPDQYNALLKSIGEPERTK